MLLLPADIEDYLTPPQLQAVVEHELCHVRRRDNLTAAVHMLVEASFWFHPLVWWIGARLVDERERACDEHVLGTVAEPDAYAEGILNVCKRYVESPVVCVSGVTGSDLKKRIADIINRRVGSQLTPARRITLLAAAIAAIVLPLIAGLATAPLRAQETQAEIKFEAVSIKPCTDFGPGAGRGGNSPRISMTPGYAHFGCITLANLIDHAWGGGSFPGNSLLNTPRLPPDWRPDLPKRVRGGPSWVEDDRWEVEIRMSGDKSDRTGAAFHDWVLSAMAPALQAMIADRFQLKLRKATEQRPMYAMTVAPGGLKITQTAPQKCWERPWDTPRGEPGTPPPGFEGTPSCGYGASSGSLRQSTAGAPAAPPAPPEWRADRVVNFTNINLADFASWLTRILEHGVLDRTSVQGRFSFPLEYAVDDNTPGETQSNLRSKEAFSGLRAQNGLPPEPPREPAQPKGPTIFKALETLGLKMNKTTGPAEYLLIESVQRPRPNPPSPDGLRRDKPAR